MKIMLFLLGILGLLASQSFGDEKRTYVCGRLSGEPVLDGKIRDDPVWQIVQPGTDFVKLGDAFLAAKQTVFKMGYTPEALYIAMECKEPEPEKIKTELRDIEELCETDSVEIFIYPQGSDNYYQFVVNAIGARSAYEFTVEQKTAGPKVPIPPANWSAQTGRGTDCWSAELKMPWEIFLAMPANAEKWRGNFCRNVYTSGDKYTTWANLTGGFHQPVDFGTIIFKDRIMPQEGKETKNRIIRALKEKITYNLEMFADLRIMASERLKGDSRLKNEILSFLKKRQEVENRSSEINSVEEAGRCAKESRGLLVAGEELKGKILLQNLFDE